MAVRIQMAGPAVLGRSCRQLVPARHSFRGSRVLPLVTLALAVGANLAAQTPSQDDLAAELLKVIDTPVESVSKRLQKSIEAPQAVEVITSDQIRTSGAFRLADVLRLASSLQVWDMDGERTNVTIRGVSPQGIGSTVQILVDGVPLYNTVALPVDLNGLPIPIEAIEKVEIVRGPSSSLYGANAQMGVIAITTRRAGQGIEGSLRSGIANGGRFRQEGFLAYGERAYSITASVGSYSDRSLGRPMEVMGQSGGSIPHSDAGHGSQVYLRPEAKLAHGGKVWMAYGYGDAGHSDQLILSPLGLTPVANSVNRSTNREVLQAGWHQPWSATFSTEVSADQKTYNLRVAPIQEVPGSTASSAAVSSALSLDPSVGTTHDLFHERVRRVSLQSNWNPRAGLFLIGGVDASRIETGSMTLLGLSKDDTYSASGGFFSVDWKVGQVTVSGGVRAANETLGGTSTSPRVSVVWSLDATTAVRMGYFTSTRSPMVIEKLGSMSANPLLPMELVTHRNLQSEKAEDYEVGFRKHWTRMTLDVTYFVTELKHIVALGPEGQPTAGQTAVAFQNTPTQFSDSGLEVSVTMELSRGVMAGWNLSTVRFKDPIYGLDQQADYSPKGQSNLWLRFHRGVVFGYLALEEVGSYSVVVPGTQTRTDIHSYAQTHFNIGVTPVQGLSVSIYAINASREAQNTSNMGLLNAYALRYARREAGLQAAFRF